MNLSHKLTFSLASVFLLLAFAVVPAMAHAPGANVAPHDHPSAVGSDGYTNDVDGDGTADDPGNRVDLNGDNDFDDTGEQIPLHNPHPVVTSITLKPGDAVRGMMAKVVADDTGTTDVAENTFTLVVDFDRDIAAANNLAAVPDFTDGTPTADAQLVLADLAHSTLLVNNTAATDSTITTINRVKGDNSKYEIVITPAILPDADTDDANDDTLTFRIQVSAEDGTNGVFSLQTSVIRSDSVDAVTIPGGGNLASMVYSFKLVKELPPVTPPPDTTAPTLMITHSPADEAMLPASGNVTFTFTFNEALGSNDNGFSLTDVTIENGSVVDFGGSGMVYTLEVKPTDPMMDVKVTVAANAVADGDGNNLAADVMQTYMADDTENPTVVITSAKGTGDDAGKIIVTFTFSEELMAGTFTSEDIDRTQTNVLLDGEPMMSATDPKVYTVKVTPPATGSATIVLKTGSVSDMQGNKLQGDQSHTYTPTQAETAATITAPADTANAGNTAAGATVTVTFSKDPGTVTAMIGTTAATVTGTGTSRMIMIPAGQAEGSVAIALTWALNGSGTVTYTIPASTPSEVDTATSSRAITIQPESFVVVVRDMDAMNNEGIKFRSDVTVVEWATMPNLERLFYTGNQGVILGKGGGGALILNESATQAKDRRVGSVGISEIMWGIDEGHLGDESQDKSVQWIELHNLNAAVQDADDGVAKVYLSWKTGRDITSDSALTGNLANPVLDVVTNFFNNRPGGAAWAVKGKSGNSIAGNDFASMARILPDQKSAYANADGARYDNRDGRNAGHWNASTAAYLNARTTIADGTDVAYKYLGTPGRANHVKVDTQPHVRQTRSFKPAANIIVINEVGNNSNNAYDWIELRNASGGEINLKNYLVTKVLRDGDTLKEVVIVRFPANDNVKLKSNEVFLILASEPADDLDHPIAATGYNVDKPAQEQVPGTPNSPVRYKVASFDLSNDGNVVLMVRKPDSGHNNGPGQHKDQGTSETASTAHGPDLQHIVDVAGYYAGTGLRHTSYPNPVSTTHLWPLYAFDPPHFTNNRFDVNTVHQRNKTGGLGNDRAGVGSANNINDGNTAFGNRGWTGVGYRRAATQNNANGGTPGYPNGAFHDKGGTITSLVYISEIMYADDARGSLAQWIELRNPSPTLGANLHNWRLTITNHDSKNEAGDAFEGRGSSTVLLRGLEIKPNSAVLITSRKGPRTDVRLPDADIFVLYPTYRNDFSMANATTDILSPYGFNILLEANAHDTNKKHEWQKVDEVGNLAARRTASRAERADTERYDAPRWMLPNAMTEDGARISIARRNVPGGTLTAGFDMADGKEESGWILSNMDRRTDVISPTYYGHMNDWSTPGQTRGQPLPVELSYFRPTLENGKVTIQWTTESELDNAGFNILRSETRNGEFTQVNEQMIQGKGTTAERTTYKWVDTTAKPGAVYYYQIEDVSFAGERTKLATTKLKGLISAKGKLTTQWGDLKNLR